MYYMWIFEKENKSTKIILVISVNIFRILRPLQCRPNIKLIRNFQRGLSFCFDCPCGAAIWSGCYVNSAKLHSETKIFLQLTHQVNMKNIVGC